MTEVRDAADLEAWLAVRTRTRPLDEGRGTHGARRTSGTSGPFRQIVARDEDRRSAPSRCSSTKPRTARACHVDAFPDARGAASRDGRDHTGARCNGRGRGQSRSAHRHRVRGALYRGLGFEVVGEVTVFSDAGSDWPTSGADSVRRGGAQDGVVMRRLLRPTLLEPAVGRAELLDDEAPITAGVWSRLPIEGPLVHARNSGAGLRRRDAPGARPGTSSSCRAGRGSSISF